MATELDSEAASYDDDLKRLIPEAIPWKIECLAACSQRETQLDWSSTEFDIGGAYSSAMEYLYSSLAGNSRRLASTNSWAEGLVGAMMTSVLSLLPLLLKPRPFYHDQLLTFQANYQRISVANFGKLIDYIVPFVHLLYGICSIEEVLAQGCTSNRYP